MTPTFAKNSKGLGAFRVGRDNGRALDRFVRQRTLKTTINCSGTGLHSGAKAAITLHPADANTGIVFHRTDIAGAGALIPARYDRVVDTRLCTVLGNDKGITVATVEHLVAALAGFGIDNCIVDVHGPEVPIMDGSAEPFSFLIDCAGIVEQDAPRKAIEILKPVSVGDREKCAMLSPASTCSVSVEIDFENQVVARQKYFFDFSTGNFQNEISRARTFGFEKDVQQLRAMGLAQGGSLENAVVVGHDRVLNEDGLRFDDEFVRHKLLDSIGDLYLAGGMVLGHFHGFRAGHALNNQLLRTVFADPSAWRVVEVERRPEAVAVNARGERRRAAAR
ncbi:MAG: UDP-3-O-acyl-N-acetylglucosamine deacetylase [Alphaproteobacteria bacterium]